MFKFMKEALNLAKEAEKMGEVPVGAVIVKDGEIIGKGKNTRETENNPIGHAEINAILDASKNLGSWRLDGCEMYVTLEPCAMCMGALINSRIKKITFGAFDLKAGACGSVVNLNNFAFNHHPKLLGGIMEDECGEILTEFFKKLRK